MLNFVWTNSVVVVAVTVCLSKKWIKLMVVVKFSIISNALHIYANYATNINFIAILALYIFLDKIWKLLTYHTPSSHYNCCKVINSQK